MQPNTRTDSLAISGLLDNSWSWLVTLAAIVLGVLLWLLIEYQKRISSKNKYNIQIPKKKLSYHQVRVSQDKIKKTQGQRSPKTKKKTESKTNGVAGKKVNANIPEKTSEVLEPSSPKYVGYKPVNIFQQTEPMCFPYVMMPKENSVIKFPQKGRMSRKGYKEDDFYKYLQKNFLGAFQLFDDRFILIKGSNKPFEPDFALIDERNGLNIVLDIEIDEPYEGINNIQVRKPTHFQFADTNRNNAFKNRGWIVIRFAEIQVHQNPEGCCLFIADVLRTINPKFQLKSSLLSATRIAPVPQWTKDQAIQMSRERFREKYLGIKTFGFITEAEKHSVNETILGQETEEIVKDDPTTQPTNITAFSNDPIHGLVQSAISNKQFVSFEYEGNRTIVKPNRIEHGILSAYCYVTNAEKSFGLPNISNAFIKESAFAVAAKGPHLGIERTRAIVNTAIVYHKYIRIRYTRSSWSSIDIDENDEVVTHVTVAEESIRTISNVQLSIHALDTHRIQQYNLNENYITAFCHRRNDQRTFKFDRISELAILNI